MRKRSDHGGQKTDPKPLDRDEKVKLDLPFGTALRGLLKTPPPKPQPPAPRKP
jgi:hypothetical protein